MCQELSKKLYASDLIPHEDFIGLYKVSSTTGTKDLAQVASDILLKLNLPLSCIQGHNYDGAANMAGGAKGVQAVIREKKLLALYVHSGPHCSSCPVMTESWDPVPSVWPM